MPLIVNYHRDWFRGRREIEHAVAGWMAGVVGSDVGLVTVDEKFQRGGDVGVVFVAVLVTPLARHAGRQHKLLTVLTRIVRH